MICSYCGRQIDDDQKYCSFCGRRAIHVPPVFTMTSLGTDIATEAIRSYSEWGFYNSPDAELDPETGRKPEYSYSALDALPSENPLKWARDFMEADKIMEAEQEEAEQAPEEDASEEDASGSEPAAKERTRSKRRIPVAVIVILLVFVAAAVAGGGFLLLEKNKTYEADLGALMEEPKVIGYNNFGEMALMPQIDAVKEDEWMRNVTFDRDRKEFGKVLDTVTYTPDKTKDLSNGDVVKITIDYNRKAAADAGLKIITEDITYEVKGLEKGKDLAYDPDAYHAYYDDFILPESDRTYLNREDVAYSTNGSIDMTQQAINEIYARHGWIFKDDHYDKLFRGFDWYVPMYKPDEFDNSWLNDYEKTNMSLLTQYRNDLKKAAEKAAAEKAAKEAAASKASEKAAEKTTEEDDD